MLEKTISIDGRDVTFKCSGVLPLLYRTKFRRDLLIDLAKLQDAQKQKEEHGKDFGISELEIFEKIAYIMALHADPSIPKTIEGWFEQFELFSIHSVLPEIMSMWESSLSTTVDASKNPPAPQEN